MADIFGTENIDDFNFHEGDIIYIGFSHNIDQFSENEATGEILFNGHAFARVDANKGSNFFDLHRDLNI